MLRIVMYLLIVILLFPCTTVAYEYEGHLDPETLAAWQPVIQRVRGYAIFVVVVNPANGHKAILGIDGRFMKILYYGYYWEHIWEQYIYDLSGNRYISVYPRHEL